MEKTLQCKAHHKYDAKTLHLFRTDSFLYDMPELYRESDMRFYFPSFYLRQSRTIEEIEHISFLSTTSCRMKRVNNEFRQRNCDAIDLLTKAEKK